MIQAIKRWWRGTPVTPRSPRADGGVVLAVRWHWTARWAHAVVRGLKRVFSSPILNTALALVGLILAYLGLK